MKTSYCIDLDTRDRQVLEGICRVSGRLGVCEDNDETIAVVCYGPSLEDTWEELKDFKHTITCSGAHKYLIDRGVIPTFHTEVDPRAHKSELIGQPHPDVKYLISSVCHKDVFDLLEGYNVKLWHVFSYEAYRPNVIVAFPYGEWALTGGSNVGLRAIVLARFLGFKKMVLFGMDYSFRTDGSQHAGWHPKEIQNYHVVYADGEPYFTNPGMHQYAQVFFKEMEKTGQIEIEARGNGLLQALIRERLKDGPLIKSGGKPAMIAAMTAPTISPEYAELNRRLHETNPYYGTSGSKRSDAVRKLIESTKPETILDYGCGKSTLSNSLSVPIWEYDPAIPGKTYPPRPADLVICTDVLEHVEPEFLKATILDLSRCILKVGYFVINTGPSQKYLEDGRNAHLIQEGKDWWNKTLSEFLYVGSIEQNGSEVVAVVGPRKNAPQTPKNSVPELDTSNRVTPVRRNNAEALFYTPNDMTMWRARSLFTKEPITIEWIEGMVPGEVLYDVGANVGGYTVWAAKRGVNVYSFEPEAENFAVLTRNLQINDMPPNAYPIALGDRSAFDALNLSKSGAGGSCHQFAKEREGAPKQGCIGMRLDDLPLPHPDHIKIDVDGSEPLVVAGALERLKWVKSLLVEVNRENPEHMEMVELIVSKGFTYDTDQVEDATRKEGAFKGHAEFLFRANNPILEHLIDRIETAEIAKEPSPYIYIENVFPDEVYAELLESLPEEYAPISEVRPVNGYPDRSVSTSSTPFLDKLSKLMRQGELRKAMCKKFGIEHGQYTDETLLIRDHPGYSIGPHTDSSAKAISALFYLPKDDTMLHVGTSMYVPNEEGFKCPGGPHYDFEKFTSVAKMPFKPNSMFAFLKTNVSFHGVEPWDEGIRDVLLYDVRRKK